MKDYGINLRGKLFLQHINTDIVDALDMDGRLVYDPTDETVYFSNGVRWINAGSNGGTSDVISMNGHGFSVLDPVRNDGNTWLLAQGDTEEHAESLGIVTEVINSDVFRVTYSGMTEFPSGTFVSGTTYALDPDAPQIKSIDTIIYQTGDIRKAMIWAISDDVGYILNRTGFAIEGVDAKSSYAQAFNNTVDWGTASGGIYTLIVTESLSGCGLFPHIQVEELSGYDFIRVDVDTMVKANGDIHIRVTESPDNRFNGRILITET